MQNWVKVIGTTHLRKWIAHPWLTGSEKGYKSLICDELAIALFGGAKGSGDGKDPSRKWPWMSVSLFTKVSRCWVQQYQNYFVSWSTMCTGRFSFYELLEHFPENGYIFHFQNWDEPMHTLHYPQIYMRAVQFCWKAKSGFKCEPLTYCFCYSQGSTKIQKHVLLKRCRHVGLLWIITEDRRNR